MKQQAWNPGALLFLILLGAVSFTLSDPFILKVSNGQSATLYCNESLPAASQAQWTKRGVSGDKHVILTIQKDGRVDKEIADLQNRFQIKDRFNIHIERVDPEDIGTYECGGRETSLIVLTDPASCTVSEGRSVTLFCGDSAVLAGKGTVRWARVNGSIYHSILYKDPAGNIVKHVNDPDNLYQLTPDSSLYISKVKSTDAGRYECNKIHVADLNMWTDPSKPTVLTTPPKKETATTTSKTTDQTAQSNTSPLTTIATFSSVSIIMLILAAAIFIILWKRRSTAKACELDNHVKYALVSMPDENKSQDNTYHVYETVKDPTTAINNNQDCKEHLYYLVIQEPNALQNNSHTTEEFQYALVQLPKVDKNSDQDEKETEYSLLHAPKATDSKSQNSKEPEYELVKAPMENIESQDINESEYSLVQASKSVK
ncbi:uncharacterized protein LOC121298679 isoform X2 [Polyodon spathula]|uniref:uncharacterized protein LOC121298679 isoform X2 n=1 Tax=Polyodon spathula TaxID=7913 RepID=UPI001B7E6AB3|nr:uncharacterized protein LOC121298679 isoform X2 [Polyodon spathula]